MKATAFQQRFEARLSRARNRLETELAKPGVSPNDATAARAKFEAAAQRLKAELDAAVADGVVTRDEADSVRQKARSLREELRLESKGRKQRDRTRHHRRA
jgi:hypothetical protein